MRVIKCAEPVIAGTTGVKTTTKTEREKLLYSLTGLRGAARCQVVRRIKGADPVTPAVMHETPKQ